MMMSHFALFYWYEFISHLFNKWQQLNAYIYIQCCFLFSLLSQCEIEKYNLKTIKYNLETTLASCKIKKTDIRLLWNSWNFTLPYVYFMKKKTSDTSKKCISPNKIKALIVFGKMHFLGISENNFFSWNKAYRNDKFHGFLDFYRTKKRLVKILKRVLHKTL